MKFELNLDVLAERIKQVRLELGIAQKEVAKAIDVYAVTVYRLESGKGASLDSLLKYINFLGTQGVYVPELFEVSFSIDRALRREKDSLGGEKKSVNLFARQISDILELQKEKSVKQYDELISLANKLSAMHSS